MTTTAQREPLAYPFEQPDGLGLHPVYAELRQRPAARVRMPYGEDAWLVTRYADAKSLLGDPRFSMAAAVGRDRPRVRPVAVSGGGLLSTDGPDHHRLRGTVAKAFTARRVERLRDRVREIARELSRGMRESGPVADLGDRFAFPLAITVIGELLGISQENHVRVRDWLDVMMSHTVTAEEFHKWNSTFAAYTADLVELRRRDPGDDLFSALVRAHDQEGRISMGSSWPSPRCSSVRDSSRLSTRSPTPAISCWSAPNASPHCWAGRRRSPARWRNCCASSPAQRLRLPPLRH
ncbi:hypothetical protein SHKM778_57000 [Streptomyces sp. KM77-8]|uniref:Cytochrome P450 n=1 Tax=Streptomyces haneummycinicus TaxID=3074435 RepID=A0AAT9HPN4_9ACTN